MLKDKTCVRHLLRPAAATYRLGFSRDSAREFNIEVLDPLTSEDFAWLPLPTRGRLSGPQCAALCAHLHTYLSFYAPPTLPTDDEAAVGDILAYVTKVAREFRKQRYDDNNAPLLYVHIQVEQASCSALLDSGASRNFMSQAFMQRVGLGAQVWRKANPTVIKLADGRTQQLIDRYIEAVPVSFAPHACEPVTFNILDTDFGIILGMPWLASVDHTVNFHRRTLTVRDAFGAEVPCTIPLPHPSIRCQVVTAKSFRATCAYEKPDEIGLCFLRTDVVGDSSPTDLSSDPRVVRLLDEFTDIFESPTGVVPDRPISHEIILEVGVVPPKGCIYRMSEEELTVLRAQLDDLLDKGWIRPSNSPYGAPVLFQYSETTATELHKWEEEEAARQQGIQRQQAEAAAARQRAAAEAAAAAQLQQQQLEVDQNQARYQATMALARDEATYVKLLRQQHFQETEEQDRPTEEERDKEGTAVLMETLLYTCNWQQRELLATRQVLIRHETTLKAMDKRIVSLQARNSTLHAANSQQQILNSQQQTLNTQLQTDVSTGLAQASAAAPTGSAATLNDRVDQRPVAVAKEWKMPNFKIEKFDDYHKTDPLQWWLAFNEKADVHHTPPLRRLDALYLQLIGGAKVFMTHMVVTLECTIATLHTKITWEEFEKKWKTRFMVNNDKRHAMNKIFRIYQGQQTSRKTPALGTEFQYETFDDLISKARDLIQVPASTRTRKMSSVRARETEHPGSAATTFPSPPESAALLAASLTSGDTAVVASSRVEYENYDVELVPPLNQLLHVQDSSIYAAVPSTGNEPVASPTLLSEDPSTWTRLEDLNPLTVEDFQWLPLLSTGSLPTPHCNVLMAHLREYLHGAVPPPSTDDGVAVVDLCNYLAKIDREYATRRYVDNDAPLLYIRIQIGNATCSALIDCGATRNYINQDFMARAGLGPRVRRKSQPTHVMHVVAAKRRPSGELHRHTVHVRDRRGELVPCTVSFPHPSIGCHVVSAASIRQSIRRNDIEEMGTCFLHALPPGDQPKTDTSDPRIIELLDSYEDVFQAPAGVIPDWPIRHGITLEDGVVPPRGCIYRMSEEELQVLRGQLDDLLATGWIRPSCSPYGAPVLFVRKKNKDLRFCLDYQKLNAQTIKNVGPLPRIDDVLERLGGTKYFSKLDLKFGYHQIEIQPRDQYKTTFKTRYGHFEWIVMPFGLTNAPATFKAAMTTEFRDLLDRTVLRPYWFIVGRWTLDYLDDILVYSRTLDKHLEHLRVVLERLRIAKYKANRDKCEFAQQELEYLGHYVTPQGIHPLADKVQAIQDWSDLNHGVPEDIVSDRDTRFMSAFWTALMVESSTSMKPSSAQHPQTDGQTEHAHQTAPMMLRTLIRPDQKDWVDRLPDIEFAYNTSVHPAIGVTPFELHHGGRKGRIFADILLPRAADIDTACSPSSTRKYRELLAKARANMQKAQVHMQQQANRRRIPCPIRTGDLVWVTSEEFALEQDVLRKLLPKWFGVFGPWMVTLAAGDDPAGPSFIIEIPPHLTVHPIFHASKLAVYTPASVADFPGRRSQDPPSMDGHQEVDRVLTHRKHGNKPMQYKATFKQCDPNDTRRISRSDLKTTAPLIFAHYEKQRLAKEAAQPARPVRASDRQLHPRS
ncbi:hypothetical protein CBR_g41564 [Chara braunii]|uniref:Reverse transcriptase n=1 Tax=Chara braunii TaxID=69332 RepID=A0A388K2S5_CHABU|nr:hypothetical protein CBR_g41564 [Chara braunii]|eukprot:GBG64364.1 hypothetical protein CBR_g41564 [Chara braunii]